MSATTPALFAAAAGVGFGHAVLPDHWVPLAVLGRARRYPLGKIARLSGLAGVAHVLLSIVLGAAIIAIGLQFRSAVSSAQDAIIGGLLIATGLGFGVLQATGRGHHHDHAHDHGHGGHDHDHDGDDHDHDATTMTTTATTTTTAATVTGTRIPTRVTASAGWRRSWCRSARRHPRT